MERIELFEDPGKEKVELIEGSGLRLLLVDLDKYQQTVSKFLD